MTHPPLSRRLRSALFVALRAAFRAMPMSESRRDLLRSRFLRAYPTVRPLPAQGQVGTSTERRPRVRADERCIGYVEYSEEPLPDPLPATLVAFYLPQFHTIPENDAWWGKGFTEWRNVTRALPQFEGHLQPRLPGDLGFYDLRNPQVMRDQAKLAKTYGLSAFCFYFYWFGGKTLLEEPLRNWLADKSIDFQYCLCWANENWTRRWDGNDDEILIAQNHSPDDDLAFIAYIADYLRDPRYLRVDGKPMLLLYRPMLLPDPKATAERWRAWCRDNDIGEIHLAYVQSFERPDPREIGFNAAVEFPPNLGTSDDVTSRQCLINEDYAGRALDWRTMARDFMARGVSAHVTYSGVNCGWDNEARCSGRGRTFLHASPSSYSCWLADAIGDANNTPVFINAWNEWAEGAVLEPDIHNGYSYLEYTRRALTLRSEPQYPVAIIHAWHAEELTSILEKLMSTKLDWKVILTTSHDRIDDIQQASRHYSGPLDVICFANRGRDILPFLTQIIALPKDQPVLKLHTKRSPHIAGGRIWLEEILEDLVLEGNAAKIMKQFERLPLLGVVSPSRHTLPVDTCTTKDNQSLSLLKALAGFSEAELMDSEFPAGSMFWCRPAALASLNTLNERHFEVEKGQVDGTMAHAIERSVIAVARSNGFETLGFPTHLRPRHPYPFVPDQQRGGNLTTSVS